MATIPGRKNPTNKEFEALLELFEKQMRDLEIEYERYFNGIERRPPIHLRRQLSRTAREVDLAFITNTALKFRARQLQQRLVTYQTYWNRVMRQIEEGTFIRDLKKANRRQERQEQQKSEQRVYDLGEEMSGFSFDDLAAELEATFDAFESRPASEVEARGVGLQPPVGGRETASRTTPPRNPQPSTPPTPPAVHEIDFDFLLSASSNHSNSSSNE